MEQYVIILTIFFAIGCFAETGNDIENNLSPFFSLRAASVALNSCARELVYDATEVGEIKSPNYDSGSYEKRLSCSYRIQAPYGYRIKITFKDLDIKLSKLCNKDRLALMGQEYGGQEDDSLLGVFCGNTIPRPVLSREGENEIRMSFETKTSSGRGFHIQYEASPDLELCGVRQDVCRNRNCYKKSKRCNGRDDCGDGTDEEGCGVPVTKPSIYNCGITPIVPNNLYVDSNRLVAAVPNSWPWQVSLQYMHIEPNGHFCGGTLISAQWVISAAHCFTDISRPSEVRVVLGSHHKYNKTRFEVTRVAERIILNHYDKKHDISMIKLNAPVTFTKGVQPACLWWRGVVPGWKCFSTGWGEFPHSEYSKELKQSIQFIKDAEECQHDEDTQICVERPLNDPCLGDSGGPLTCFLENRWHLIGSASYNAAGFKYKMGQLCKPNESKSIFTKIADKQEWIKDVIDDNP